MRRYLLLMVLLGAFTIQSEAQLFRVNAISGLGQPFNTFSKEQFGYSNIKYMQDFPISFDIGGEIEYSRADNWVASLGVFYSYHDFYTNFSYTEGSKTTTVNLGNDYDGTRIDLKIGYVFRGYKWDYTPSIGLAMMPKGADYSSHYGAYSIIDESNPEENIYRQSFEGGRAWPSQSSFIFSNQLYYNITPYIGLILDAELMYFGKLNLNAPINIPNARSYNVMLQAGFSFRFGHRWMKAVEQKEN